MQLQHICILLNVQSYVIEYILWVWGTRYLHIGSTTNFPGFCRLIAFPIICLVTSYPPKMSEEFVFQISFISAFHHWLFNALYIALSLSSAYFHIFGLTLFHILSSFFCEVIMFSLKTSYLFWYLINHNGWEGWENMKKKKEGGNIFAPFLLWQLFSIQHLVSQNEQSFYAHQEHIRFKLEISIFYLVFNSWFVLLL